jgi:phosphoglycolate phosphatase
MQASKAVVVFDLDGTLVDSVRQIGANLNRARIDLNFCSLPQTFYDENVGLPIELLISDLKVPIQIKQDLISRFREYLISDIRLGNNHLFPGVHEAMQLFLDNGVSLAIATSKPTKLATCVYENSILNQYPFFIQGTDGFPPKPNSEVIKRVLLNFPDTMAVMVGDRSEDVVAALGAEISAIGIAAGAHSMATLSDSGASIVFPSFSEFAFQLQENFDQIINVFK